MWFLSIDLIMGSDIEQDDLFLDHSQRESDAARMSYADGVQSFQFSFECMQSEMWLKGIGFQAAENFGKRFLQVGVGSRELCRPPIEIAGRDQRIHQALSRSSSMSVCAVT